MDSWLSAALVIVDVQQAIDAPYWANLGARNNVQAEQQIAALLAYWREHKRPIVHVRHSSTDEASSYHARGTGFAFKYAVKASVNEVVVTKRTHSAFVNTSLHAELKQLRCDRLIVCGLTTNHSVDATVRHAAGLGYQVGLVAEACAAFPLQLENKTVLDAQQVHDIFVANLAGEYCQLLSADQLMA